MTEIPEEVEGHFRTTGWEPGRVNTAFSAKQVLSNSHALPIFKEFGGLNVGSCGSGQEQAASNISFFASPVPAKCVAVANWQPLLGELTPIADAHHDHMIIYMSQVGAYYFFTDPDEKLYLGGFNFGEAMLRLLLGRSYGPEIAPN